MGNMTSALFMITLRIFSWHFLAVPCGVQKAEFYVAEKNSQYTNKLLCAKQMFFSDFVLLPFSPPAFQYSLDTMKDCTSIYMVNPTLTIIYMVNPNMEGEKGVQLYD